MSLTRRKGSPFYHLDIAVPAELQHVYGLRIRESTGTADKKLAQELHDRRKADLWRQHRLGEKPAYTLADAITRWKKRATTLKLRSADDVGFRLDWWAEALGGATPLASLKRQHIMAAVEGKMTIPKNSVEQPRPASPATINRYLQAMRGLLHLCAGEWEMIDAAPTITLMAEPKGRVRTLDRAQMMKLIGELPEHWRRIFVFELATGLRKMNAVRLRKDQVDLERRRLLVGSEEFKNGEDFGIPLNDTALEILAACWEDHKEFVFVYEGKPMRDLQHRTWKKALQKAGITDFRWHDLRHTWATSFVESGGDLDELQKLGGWKSREMVLRYAHYRTAHLRQAATRVDKVFGGLLQKEQQVTPGDAAQSRHTEDQEAGLPEVN